MHATYNLRIHITGTSAGELETKAKAVRRAARALENHSVDVRYLQLQHVTDSTPQPDDFRQRMRRRNKAAA